MKKLAIVFVLILLTGCGSKEISSGMVSCNQKNELLKSNDAVLIDVRSKEEYDEGHLEGAINIPYTEIGSEISKYANKDTKVIVYCLSGKRASTAFEQLKNNGYKNIYNLGSINNCKG